MFGAPAPGFTELYQATRCCGALKIPIRDRGCLHRFNIGDRCVAEVKGSEVSALKPFHFVPDEDVLQIQSCVNFTHEIHCDLEGNRKTEKRVHHELTPCS